MFGPELPDLPARAAAAEEELASLRRVAALVSSGAPATDVFAAIAREVALVLGPRSVQIWRSERDGTATVVGAWGDEPNPYRVGSNWPLDDPSLVALAERAAPIVVDGERWGMIGVAAEPRTPSPDRIEERLAEFTELVATAISNVAGREQLARLADEQAALRRVALLVARGAPPGDVFEAVAGELGRLLQVASTGLVRFDEDETATVVAGWGRLGEVVPVGARLPVGGMNVISQIARTGKPARVDNYASEASGPVAEQARRLRTQASVGGPIMVAGRLWGAMVAAALEGDPLLPDTEPRLEQFTELVGTAIANAQARVELARLADEQAALRRVATLVAEEAPADELFAKVAEEVAGVFGTGVDSAILRYEPGDMATVVAVWGEQPPGGIRVGARLPVDGDGASARVYRERRPVRVDEYGATAGAIADHARTHGIRSAIGSPILVQGRLWGAMVVAHYEAEPFPADTERRVAQFTALVATALANAEARAELRRLADEQAALRRVATLVAEAATPTEVFDAVVEEVAQLFGAAQVGLMRAEHGNEITIVAHRGQHPGVVHDGMRLPLDGESATARVLRTGRSARINQAAEGSGTIGEIAQRSNANATVGAPVTVEGRLWGVITASWEGHDPPPDDAEQRLTAFARLLETAIANADSRDQLKASRARLLTAGDEARRRLVRDLHDGAQQRLVHTIVTLKLARHALSEDIGRADALLAEALGQAESSNAELRELAHGILPSVLTRGGLRAGVRSLVARLDLPVAVDVTPTRLGPEIEASAYFIVAEALTNVVKHARAARAEVAAGVDDGILRVEVRDDGIGGADPHGHGLVGVSDRAAALGGRLRIDSPRGGGTVLAAELPLST